ncbi:hypothetical protein ANN_23013 [Periplaneta americana]|uniref:Uncharacterized protein n=1 Tax=Periplaneta americana TaxID=6978 RepID=A0ABQ8SL61_PERAM|nr:hypothetical protein ANN_23013 [Periplaneta americana]
MAGLCEGGNEPPGSLKASKLEHIKTLEKIQKQALKCCRKNSPLKWDTLKDRRTRIRLCALFKTYRVGTINRIFELEKKKKKKKKNKKKVKKKTKKKWDILSATLTITDQIRTDKTNHESTCEERRRKSLCLEVRRRAR